MSFFCAGFSSEANKSQKKSQKGGMFLVGVDEQVCMYVCVCVCGGCGVVWCVGVNEKA